MPTEIKGIDCSNCRVVLYIQSGRPDTIPPHPFPDLSYCPVCGFKAKECNDYDAARYQVMSYHYGLPPDTMRQFFRLHMNYLRDEKNRRMSFDDWFKQTIKEALSS